MKIIYSWLKEFVDIDLTPAQLAEKLTALGIEVAEIAETGADFEGVTAVKITHIEKHPNADKLRLATVDLGGGQTKRIVCGAPNIEVGQTVPLALDGARLGKNILKASEIRGIMSEGMLCSADELGLAKERAHGILILDNSVALGTAVNTLFGKKESVLELEITPNRPDLLSHLGVARELAILLNLPLKKPATKKVEGKFPCIPVAIKDAANCPRYTGLVIKGAKNVESPTWMKERLSALGINPKSALIDITNYVLFELGHPLHAFDLGCLDGGEINVRMGAEGEQFKTLDERDIALNNTNLVIAGKEKASALAGIMGGIDSGIRPDTQDVFLESAYFYPPCINKTAKKLGYSTDASQRFERGTDISVTLYALERAANLILEICGGTASQTADVYPEPFVNPEVLFTPEQINKILGFEIPEETQKQIFSALAENFDASQKPWKFRAPAHRRDIVHKWDLAEEAVRFYGFHNVPVHGVTASVAFIDNPKSVDVAAKVSGALLSEGFIECKNFDFVSSKDLNAVGAELKNVIEITNPLNEDWQYLRPSLLNGLLKNAFFNQSRGTANYKLFEIGKEYQLIKGFPSENWTLGAVLTSKDFFYIKAVVQSVLRGFNAALVPSESTLSYMHPKMTMDILEGKKTIGFFGKLHPLIIKAYGLKSEDLYYINLGLKPLEKTFNAQEFKPATDVSIYPHSTRDLSLVLDNSVAFAKIESAIASCGIWAQMAYKLVDVYEGEKLGADKKSITISFDFWLNERTLVDKEVEELTNKIITALAALGAELRK